MEYEYITDPCKIESCTGKNREETFEGCLVLNRTVTISLLIVLATVLIPAIIYFVLPDPQIPEDAPTAEEVEEVKALIEQAAEQFPDLEFTRVRTTHYRVAIVEARWTGPNQPERGNPDAWNIAADAVAEVIADSYLPAGWQVNVHLYRTRFQLMGVAGRPSALDGPEGWLKMENQ